MKKYLPIGLILLCFMVYGCSNRNDFDFDEIVTVKYGQEIAIPLNRSIRTIDKKFVVKFESVITDSRCPDGAMCFWQGVAGIRMLISDSTAIRKPIELYTLNFNNWSDSAFYKDINIKLLELTPSPYMTREINQDSYKAKIIISKTK